MVEYIFTFMMSLLFSCLAEKRTKYSLPFLLCSMIFPIMLAGLRATLIGTDTGNYEYFFMESSTYYSLKTYISDFYFVEVGYLALNYLISHTGGDYTIFLIFVHTLIICNIYVSAYIMRKYINVTWVIFVFLFVMYNESLNAMRQYIAISLSLLAFSVYFIFRDKMKYIFITLISISFHYSSIVCLIYPMIALWLKNNSLQKNYLKLFFFASSLCGIIIITQYVNIPIISDFINEKYSEQYLSKYSQSAVSLSLLVMYSSNSLFIWDKCYHYKRKEMDFFFLVSIVALCFCLLGYVSVQLYRLGLYAFLISIISLSYIFKQTTFKVYPFTKLCFITLFIFFWFYSYVYRGSHETYPYSSLILGF